MVLRRSLPAQAFLVETRDRYRLFGAPRPNVHIRHQLARRDDVAIRCICHLLRPASKGDYFVCSSLLVRPHVSLLL
jgi:hypothetical protein